MLITCAACGKPFEAKRSTARYCGAACRVRANNRSTAPPDEIEMDLVGATRRELEAAGRLDSILGQAALRLAERMTSSYDSGSSLAAVSRELRAVMAEALAGASVAADPLDELAARRRAIRGA